MVLLILFAVGLGAALREKLVAAAAAGAPGDQVKRIRGVGFDFGANAPNHLVDGTGGETIGMDVRGPGVFDQVVVGMADIGIFQEVSQNGQFLWTKALNLLFALVDKTGTGVSPHFAAAKPLLGGYKCGYEFTHNLPFGWAGLPAQQGSGTGNQARWLVPLQVNQTRCHFRRRQSSRQTAPFLAAGSLPANGATWHSFPKLMVPPRAALIDRPKSRA